MMKKVFAFLMAAVMLLSMGTAAAASNQDQIGKYYEVDDVKGTLPGTPSLTANTQQVYGDGLVKINKTIAPTGTENLFDITLEVQTTQQIEHRELSPDAAVVLVLDTSGSMDNSMGEGNRLTEAVKAAKAFIASFKEQGATRKIAIVRFSSSASVSLGWTDVIDANNQAIENALTGLEAVGTTNIEAALKQANALLGQTLTNAKGEPITNKNIVLLSDGEPTYHNSGDGVAGNGDHTCHLSHVNAEAAAAQISAGVGRYAVYVGPGNDAECIGGCGNAGCTSGCNELDGKKVTDWLRQDCRFATYSTQDADKLIQLFENISLQIIARAKAWIVTDPMGAQVDYVKAVDVDANAFSYDTNSASAIWDLKQDNTYTYQNGTYTYTATYRVKLDNLSSHFEVGRFYPANGVTPLTWVILDGDGNITGADQPDGGVKKAYFNVPSVQGYKGDLTFQKVDDEGKPMSGVAFALALDEKGADWDEQPEDAVYSDENGYVTFKGIPSGHSYKLTEAVPAHYTASETVKFDVSYGEIRSDDFTEKDGVLTVVNNRKEAVPLQIPITKQVVKEGDLVPPKQQFQYTLALSYRPIFMSRTSGALVMDPGVVKVEYGADSAFLKAGETFSFTIATAGAGEYTEYLTVYANPEDFKNMQLYIVEDTTSVPRYWTYDEDLWRVTTGINPNGAPEVVEAYNMTEYAAGDQVLFTNIYDAPYPPQTGDNSHIALWLSLMGVSALCFVIISKRRSA